MYLHLLIAWDKFETIIHIFFIYICFRIIFSWIVRWRIYFFYLKRASNFLTFQWKFSISLVENTIKSSEVNFWIRGIIVIFRLKNKIIITFHFLYPLWQLRRKYINCKIRQRTFKKIPRKQNEKLEHLIVVTALRYG